ncbi:MAG: ATP-binding protein [Anaerolineae bacterium]
MVEQLAALSRASQAVAASLELDQVLAEIVSLTSEVVTVDYTSVVLVDEAGHMGQSAENLPGVPAIEYRVRDEGLTSWIVRSHQAVVIDEVGEDGTVTPDPGEGAPRTVNPLIVEAGIKSVAGLPLLVKDRLLGVLYLHSLHATAFHGQLPLLTAFANQAAVAIENARLFQAEQQQTRRLVLLADAARIAATTLDASALLQAVAESIHRHFKYPMIGLFTLDNEGQMFTLRGYSGISIGSPDLTTPGIYHQPVEQGILGHVACTGKPYLAPDVHTDPYFFNPGEAPIRSALYVPILDEGDTVGAMGVESDQLADFDEEDQSLLEAVADAVAIGLRNARLHEEARLRADELATALARQEELDQLKDEFIQNVSHELRSPLALIRGYAEMLDSAELGELQPEQQKPVAVIARRARMLGDLVQNITFILEAEARHPTPEPVSLDELTQAAVEDFQVAARQAELTLHAEIAPHLPPVSGSPTYLRRVLDNLLGNAMKFTPAGGTVTVWLRQEGDQVALEVSDTGIGIEAGQLERIFERFYQVDGSAQRQYGGVGLGLALVKEIVEAYDGRVKVESQVGEGSTFTVLLPVAADVDVRDE